MFFFLHNLIIFSPQHCASLFRLRLLLPDKPSAPQNLTVTESTKDSASLRWEAPEADGGSDVIAYHVEKRDVTKPGWTAAGTTEGARCTHSATRLVEGAEYYFRVAAENKIGVGAFAELSTSVTAQLAYGGC